jgi:hypothetical protein
MSSTSIQERVKEKYGSAARAVQEEGSVGSCCNSGRRCCDPVTTNLYSEQEKGLIPEKAVLASLGCGNPTALAELRPGNRDQARSGQYRPLVRTAHDQKLAGGRSFPADQAGSSGVPDHILCPWAEPRIWPFGVDRPLAVRLLGDDRPRSRIP